MTELTKAIAVFVAVGAILFLGLPAIDGEYERTVRDDAVGDGNTIVNESWTVDTSNSNKLAHSNIDGAVYNDTVSVYSGGQAVSEDEYRWNQHNGTIYTDPGGTLTDGSTAEITYGWENATQSQKLAKDTVDIPLTNDMIFAFVAAGVIIIGLIMLRNFA